MNQKSDVNNRIKYKDSYVAFLDVLGFKNLVFSKDDKSITKLNIYFDIVDRVINYLKRINEKQKIGYIVISDSIIFTIPQSTDKEENIDNLRQLCIAVGFMQVTLAVEDIWIRGAISSGKTYFDKDNNQIVGPAYINAYLLEEKQSIFPRIILDNKIIKELKFENSQAFINKINLMHENGLDYENCGKFILFDWSQNNKLEKDIPLFIDYLSFFLKEDKLTNKEIIRDKVIENIENNIYLNTSLYSKFKWVSEYFYTIVKNQREDLNTCISRLENL